MRVALIGCGRIGRVHAESIGTHRGAELVRVCDAVEDAAREVAGLFGGTPGSDVDAVLTDPDVDAIVIASPTPTHVDLLSRAVEAARPCCARSRSISTLPASTSAWRALAATRIG
jgi:myo-inositol 2-dehydrogenase/D-chiro-inositol 1-dehydrogenase